MIAEDQDVKVPLFYVVSRRLPREEESAILEQLRITPIDEVVVSDVLDADLAFRLASNVSLVSSDAMARLFAADRARETKRPVLVIGEAESLEAVYG